MRAQIDNFDKKVDMCRQSFDVVIFHHMMKELKASPSARGYFKIERLRTLRTLISGEKKRSQTDLYNPRPSEKVLQYYDWILNIIDYLKDLKKKYENKIFRPLNTYFKDNFTPQTTPSTGTRKDSAGSGSSGDLTPVPPTLDISQPADDKQTEGENPFLPDASPPQTGNSIGRQALKELGRELEEARLLYDDSQIEHCSKNLGNVLSDWELLLFDNTELDSEIITMHDIVKLSYSHMHKDLAYLASVLPTIFDGCSKASAIARDWINLHETKTISLESKLVKVKEIHKHLTRKLHSLELEIIKHEGILETTTAELQKLINREERSNEINLKLFDTEQNISTLKETLERARCDRLILSEDLSKAKISSPRDLADVRLKYEENRLQRYLLQRKIQSKEYAKSLLDDDLQLEIGMKPTIIRHSDALHDKCEKLEQIIEEKKSNKRQLQEALVPLQEDRRAIQAKILMHSMIGDDGEEAERESLGGDVLGAPLNMRSRSVDLISKLETIEERPDSNCSTATQRSTKSIQPAAVLEPEEFYKPEPPRRAAHLTTVKIGDQEKPLYIPSVTPTIDMDRYEGMESDRSSVLQDPAAETIITLSGDESQ